MRARGLKLGLLAQHIHFDKGSTVHESALAAFGRLQQIEHEMHELEHRMADAGDDLEKVLARYSDLQHEYEREGGFEYSAKAENILQGLGFDRDSWQMETEKLSGGQQNRLGLARLLLSEPDVLLLDEPTNHLDVGAVEWLEEFLQSYPAGFVIVSHDRYFLDRACRRIIEIENGQANSYTGNYSDYLVEREERREIQQRAFENQQRLIAKTEEFIRKNLAGQKTKQAKSRRTMLQRLERIDAVRADQGAGHPRLRLHHGHLAVAPGPAAMWPAGGADDRRGGEVARGRGSAILGRPDRQRLHPGARRHGTARGGPKPGRDAAGAAPGRIPGA